MHLEIGEKGGEPDRMGANTASATPDHGHGGNGGGDGGETRTAGALAGGSEAGLDGLERFQQRHMLDPNMPVGEMAELDGVLAAGNVQEGAAVRAALVEDDSPYPEVRAAVRNYDVSLPCNTIRAWCIGLLLATLGSAVNMLFSLRNPSVGITTWVIQLVAYPLGLVWDVVFPDRVFRLLGVAFNLRPGRFNVKEHVIIVAMSNAAYGGGVLYATDVLVAQQVFYRQNFGWLFQLLFGITTLCTGYGLAGMARRFLVWPAAMVWPSNLVNTTLFYAMHHPSPSDPAKCDGWSIGRYKYFLIVMAGAFVWYWFPGWIFQGLSYFNFVCWAAPTSVLVNKLFGGLHGYGILPISLDWTVISGYTQSPLIPPWHAIANTLLGVIVFFLVFSMGLHFSGTWYADYLVVQSSSPFDNTGAVYNVSSILDQRLQLDEAAYHAYSPLFLSTQFALSYGLAFAAVASVIVHVALYHGKTMVQQFKLARQQEDDVHMRLMRKYRDVQDWWYAALFVVMVGLSFVVVVAWETTLPAWAYAVSIGIAVLWTIPIGVIQAITNMQLGLNVLTEFIVGYAVPGRPLAMMMFKNYGYLCMSQALYFAQDLKLGHYMKIPPRTLFASQLVASIWSAIVQIAVLNWALASIDGVCEEDQREGYSCPGGRVFFTASILWGAIGPSKMFGPGALYAGLQWFWLIGATAPLLTWLLARRARPASRWRYVNMPLIFGGAGMIPPATVYSYLCWAGLGFVFNHRLRRSHAGWWMQYNYITSAALDCGLVLATVLVFFALYLTNARSPAWFGNVAALHNLDQQARAVKSRVEPGRTFGPATWP